MTTTPTSTRVLTWLAAAVLVAVAAVTVLTVTAEHARSHESDGTALYPGRPGAAEGDVEAMIGARVVVDDVAVTVLDARFVPSLSDLENEDYLEIEVRLENGRVEPVSYDRRHWLFRAPRGDVAGAAATTLPDLDAGHLEPGEAVEGIVRFESGPADGFYYVTLEMPGVEDRPVWRVTRD
jgi:hypothetical protein